MDNKEISKAKLANIPEGEPNATDRAMIAQAKAENDDSAVSFEAFKAAFARQETSDAQAFREGTS